MCESKGRLCRFDLKCVERTPIQPSSHCDPWRNGRGMRPVNERVFPAEEIVKQ